MDCWIDSHAVGERGESGDFVACRATGADRHVIVVGDVAGRGAEADAAAASLHESIRDAVIALRTPATILRIAAAHFTRTLLTDSTPFASLFIAMIDERAGVMQYASAGHEPGLVFSDDGTHRHLEPTGPVLGVGTLSAFSERSVALAAGDVVTVVTDGITEARRPSGDRLEFFGSRGVVRAVTDALRRGYDPAHAICRAAIEHAQGRLTDDASAIVSRLGRPAESRVDGLSPSVA